jgi:hypothetical protein
MRLGMNHVIMANHKISLIISSPELLGGQQSPERYNALIGETSDHFSNFIWVRFRIMVFNAIFNNISAISMAVSFIGGGIPGENH